MTAPTSALARLRVLASDLSDSGEGESFADAVAINSVLAVVEAAVEYRRARREEAWVSGMKACRDALARTADAAAALDRAIEEATNG